MCQHKEIPCCFSCEGPHICEPVPPSQEVREFQLISALSKLFITDVAIHPDLGYGYLITYINMAHTGGSALP